MGGYSSYAPYADWRMDESATQFSAPPTTITVNGDRPGWGIDTASPYLGTQLPGSSIRLRVPSTNVNPLQTSTAMKNTGLIMQAIGAIGSAFGNFYQAQAQQANYTSQALNDSFQAGLAGINARRSDNDAESVLEAGKSQIFNYTMQAGQEKATEKNEAAGHGIQLGSGSEAEVEASMDLVKDINVENINRNSVQQAENDRIEAQNERNQQLLYETSAANARRSAQSISPGLSLVGGLLGGTAGVGLNWLSGTSWAKGEA